MSAHFAVRKTTRSPVSWRPERAGTNRKTRLRRVRLRTIENRTGWSTEALRVRDFATVQANAVKAQF